MHSELRTSHSKWSMTRAINQQIAVSSSRASKDSLTNDKLNHLVLIPSIFLCCQMWYTWNGIHWRMVTASLTNTWHLNGWWALFQTNWKCNLAVDQGDATHMDHGKRLIYGIFHSKAIAKDIVPILTFTADFTRHQIETWFPSTGTDLRKYNWLTN